MRIFLFLFAAVVSLQSAELKVVSLSPALTELVCALGKESSLVGRSDACNYPLSVKKLPVAGRFAVPFTEKILALKPTLLISNDFVNPNVKRNFERAGIKVLQLPCRNFEEYRRCVEIVGKEVDAQEQAKKELEKIDFLRNKKPSPNGLQVLWVVWDAPLMTPGRRSHLHKVIELAGGQNATGEFDFEYVRPSFDKLLKKKIDVIIWSGSGAGWKQRRIWQRFPAVKNNQILADFEQDVLLRPGPRMKQGIENLEKILKKWKKQ